jgi:hypothetical protein
VLSAGIACSGRGGTGARNPRILNAPNWINSDHFEVANEGSPRIVPLKSLLSKRFKLAATEGGFGVARLALRGDGSGAGASAGLSECAHWCRVEGPRRWPQWPAARARCGSGGQAGYRGSPNRRADALRMMRMGRATRGWGLRLQLATSRCRWAVSVDEDGVGAVPRST